MQMFAVIYEFKIKSEDLTEAFVENWRQMTMLIAKYEKGLGSRLHKKDSLTYIAYAQWPDQNTFEISGNHLPEEADLIRKKMRACCEKVTVLHKLQMTDDLLVKSD